MAAMRASASSIPGAWRRSRMVGVFVYALLEASQFALLPVYALDRGMGEGMAAAGC